MLRKSACVISEQNGVEVTQLRKAPIARRTPACSIDLRRSCCRKRVTSGAVPSCMERKPRAGQTRDI